MEKIKDNSPYNGFKKFLLLCLLLVSYTGYLSYKYDFATGGLASLLSWSFFVLCTPVADAGFLFAFPLRLLFGVRMIISQIFVFIFAVSSTAYILIYHSHYFLTTKLTKIYYNILIIPYPYWAIIVVSTIGTFLSIILGDKLFDFVSLKKKSKNERKKHFYKSLPAIIIFTSTVILYYYLIKAMNIDM